MPKVEELFAFVTCNNGDPNDEGIIGCLVGNQWHPFIGADMTRIQALKEIADKMPIEYKILHFVLVGEILKEEI